MRQKDVTIRDVAKLAGVSIGTVSRHINGITLPDETKSRVSNAILSLGYEPDKKKKNSNIPSLTIGAVLPFFDSFHMGIISSLEKIMYKNQYNLILSEYEDDEDALESKIRFLKQRYTDGIICSPLSSDLPIVRSLRGSKIPLVSFNNRVPSWGCDHVHVNDRQSMFKAVELLVGMNHKRIAFIGANDGSNTAHEREQGFLTALQAMGIDRNVTQVQLGDWRREHSGYTCARTVLTKDSRTTAIITANYVLAFGVLAFLQEKGIAVGDDVSIISFDDTEVFKLTKPSITAIRQPLDQIAYNLAEIIFHRLSGDWSDYPRVVELPTELVVRESVKKAK